MTTVKAKGTTAVVKRRHCWAMWNRDAEFAGASRMMAASQSSSTTAEKYDIHKTCAYPKKRETGQPSASAGHGLIDYQQHHRGIFVRFNLVQQHARRGLPNK